MIKDEGEGACGYWHYYIAEVGLGRAAFQVAGDCVGDLGREIGSLVAGAKDLPRGEERLRLGRVAEDVSGVD